jgi:hypothetical protein
VVKKSPENFGLSPGLSPIVPFNLFGWAARVRDYGFAEGQNDFLVVYLNGRIKEYNPFKWRFIVIRLISY